MPIAKFYAYMPIASFMLLLLLEICARTKINRGRWAKSCFSNVLGERPLSCHRFILKKISKERKKKEYKWIRLFKRSMPVFKNVIIRLCQVFFRLGLHRGKL